MQRYIIGGQDRERILANAHAFLDRLPARKTWRIEIREHRKERTNDQNAALFGVAYPVLTEATGYTPDELHTAFCRRFFGTVDEVVFGQRISRPVRTTTTNAQHERDVLSTVDFAQFYRMVQDVGAEAGVDVPDPDPMHGIRARWAA